VLPLIKFGTPLLIVSIGYWIVQVSDRYLIKYFMSVSDVGIYSVSYGIALVIIMIWTASTSIVFPDLCALYDSGNIKELERRFSRVLKYGVAVTAAAVVGLAVLSVPILKIITSEEFIGSSGVLIVAAIGIFWYGIFMYFAVLPNILKKVKVLNSLWISMASINIILNILLIPKFGIMGAAYSTLISFLLGAIAIVLYSSSHFNIIFRKDWLMKIIISSVIMGYIVSLIPIFSLAVLVLVILIGALIYGATLFLLRFYDKSELLLFKEVFLIRNKKLSK